MLLNFGLKSDVDSSREKAIQEFFESDRLRDGLNNRLNAKFLRVFRTVNFNYFSLNLPKLENRAVSDYIKRKNIDFRCERTEIEEDYIEKFSTLKDRLDPKGIWAISTTIKTLFYCISPTVISNWMRQRDILQIQNDVLELQQLTQTFQEAIENEITRLENFQQEDLKEKIVDLTSQWSQETETFFALMHLAPVRAGLYDLNPTTKLVLMQTILTLSEMLKNQTIPEKDVEAVTKAIRDYELSLLIYRKCQKLAQLQDPLQIIRGKQSLKEFIVRKLTENGQVFFPGGYCAVPAGHDVTVKLTLENGWTGKYAKGEVINQGEGADLHGGLVHVGLKEKIYSILSLPSISIDSLKKSFFLDCLMELYFIKDLEQNRTEFTINDFYCGALREWSQRIFLGRVQSIKEAQRGGSCTLKSRLTPLKDIVSPETMRCIKFKMGADPLEDVLLMNLPLDTISPLRTASSRLGRSIIKMDHQATVQEKERARYLVEQVKIKKPH